MEEPQQSPEQPTLNETEQLKATNNEYKEMLQRLQAEFENYQKRMHKEHTQVKEFATQTLIEELLTILDDFQLALKNKDTNAFHQGIELVYSKFYSLLEKQGIQKIPTNIPFNPELHEALLQEPSEKKEGTILEELQSGYKLHNRVIRPAKIKISTGGNTT